MISTTHKSQSQWLNSYISPSRSQVIIIIIIIINGSNRSETCDRAPKGVRSYLQSDLQTQIHSMSLLLQFVQYKNSSPFTTSTKINNFKMFMCYFSVSSSLCLHGLRNHCTSLTPYNTLLKSLWVWIGTGSLVSDTLTIMLPSCVQTDLILSCFFMHLTS